MGKNEDPYPPHPLPVFIQGAGWEGGVGVGWSNLMAGQVGDHCSAEHDAEAVGAIAHHADGGDGGLEGVVFSDDDFGFGIDDVVGHGGAN
jgi:hypothetical protein